MKNSQPTNSSYKWLVVFMLWFVCFFNYADRQAISAILPKLEEEFRFTKTQQGLIGSAFMWVYAGCALLAGYAGDRMRRKDLILGGCLFWSAVTALTGWCSRFWHFIAVRALEGFGETFYFPASMSLLSDYHGPRTRSRALSLHQSSVYIGTIAGSWLGAVFAQAYGWRSGFYFFGAAGMLLALVLFFVLREPRRGASESTPPAPEPREAFGPSLAKIVSAPAVPLLMLAFVCANSIATVFLTWTPTFLFEKFHFKLSTAGLNGAVYIQFASALGAPIGGLLADRWAHRGSGRVGVQALGLLLGAGFIFLIGMTRDVTTLLIAMTCFGFFKGLYDSNIFAALYDYVAPSHRALAAGLMNTVGWGAGALGPLAVGWLADHGRHSDKMENMSEAIAYGGIVYLVGAGVLIGAVVRVRK
jgi:MFS family permease